MTATAASYARGRGCARVLQPLAYFDGNRDALSPANLIQAQRDYFGAHTFQLVDKEGIFHHQWF